MKEILAMIAVVALVTGGIFWLKNEPGGTPPVRPGKPEGGVGIPGGTTTTRPDPDGGRPDGGGGPRVPVPGFGAPGDPAQAAAQAAEAYAEFAVEIGLSPRETEEFMEALKKSNEELFGLAGADADTGEPKLPDPEKMMEVIEERERIMAGELGQDNYGKFKAFSSTLGVRSMIDRLGNSGKGLGLTAEQKASVLYGAYDDLQSGNLPGTPAELTKAMRSAVLKRSSEFLSKTDQGRLAEALEKGGVLGMGAGSGVDLPPGLPPIPDPGSGPPKPGGAVGGGPVPLPAIP